MHSCKISTLVLLHIPLFHVIGQYLPKQKMTFFVNETLIIIKFLEYNE